MSKTAIQGSKYWSGVDFKEKSCRLCGDQFKPVHPKQTHCSVECRDETQREAHRDWYGRNKSARSEYNRQWRLTDREKTMCSHYRSRYGISYSEVRRMLLEQGSKCAICRRQLRFEGKKGRDKPVVDHCHGSDKVRGILCTPCNLMVGYAYDNPKILSSAIKYLEAA